MRSDVWGYANIFRSAISKGAPYLLIELVLPGGTLIAFLLFLYQRRRNANGSTATNSGSRHALAWFTAAWNRLSLAFSAWHVADAPARGERDGLEAIDAFGLMPAR